MHPTLTEKSNGVYIIAATPFADDGSLDLGGIDALVEFYEGHAVAGITSSG